MTKRLQKFYDFFHQPEFKGYCIFTMTESELKDRLSRFLEADDLASVGDRYYTFIDDLEIYVSDDFKYFIVVGLYADEINDMRKWEV